MTDTMPSTNPLIMQAPLPLSSTPHAIVFVESDVEDYRSLLVGLAPGTEVHVLDAGADGLAHMAQVLAGRSGIDALHIISHGKEGAVSLGSLLLTSENMGTHAADLATIGAALEPDADILLYGCEVGAGSNGAAFVDELAKATGADVAASTNLTGAANLGGDWVLEYATGTVSSYNPFWQGATAKYAGVLDWQGVTDGTYDFSGPFTSSDTNGFVKYGDKFLITEGVISEGAVMFYGEAGNPSGTIVIKAEGGEVAKTFTFRDLSFSLFDWDGSGETPFTLNSLTIVTRKANGDTIDTHTRSTLYAPGTATEFKASDIMDDAGPIFDEDVASITISWTLGGDGRVSEADVSAANLNFHSITIADVTAEAPGDTTAPVVESITRATTGSGVTNLPTLQYTVTFSESVTGVDGNDFTLTTTSGNAAGTIGTVTPNADGSTYTVTINDITGTGILRLDLKNSGTGIQDEAGNPAATGFTNGQLYSVDRTAPSVTSIAPANPGSGSTNATSVTYTVTFSEAVTGVTADDFVLFPTGTATGTVSNVSGSGTTWTVTANGISGDGTLRLDLKNNGTGIVDLAGNLVSGGFSSGAAYTFDHTAPRVVSITLATPVSGPTSLDTLTYTVTFSERVTGVNANGFQLNSDGFATGSVGTVVGSADGRTYTVTVNGVTGDGMLRLDLKSSGTGIVDTAGNAAPGYTAGEAYDVDRVPPTIDSVGVPASRTYHAGENLDFTVNYSEAVTVDATNGTPFFNLVLDTGGTVKAEYVSGSGTSALTFRYVVVPGNADANGIVVDSATGIDPATGTIRDLAGNSASTAFSGVVAPTSGVLVNALAPTVTSIVRAGDELTNATSVTYTVTFSESVTGVDASDFTLVSSDGVTGNIAPVSGSGATWTVTVNDIAGDGALRLDLNASGTGIQGGSGQAIAGGYTAGQHYTFDHTAPVLSSAIEISDTALKTDETATVTFRFGEAVKDFTTAHVTVPNGELSGLSSADGGRTWTATLAPDAGVAAASNVLTLHYAGITDLAGNASTGTATSIDYAIDTERPHLVSTIAISDTALKTGDTATVTFTFNEAVTGFDIADVSVPNGALSQLNSADGGKTWTATLTPSANATSASNTLTLDHSGIMDLAGNVGSGTGASVSYEVDTVRPTLPAGIHFSDTALNNKTSAVVTFTFSEAVTGFTVDNVSAPNAALQDLASSDGGITWTATLVPEAGVNDPTNVLTLDYTGITDLAGNPGTGTIDSANYVVNTTAPMLVGTIGISDTLLAIDDTATVTFVFSEAVTGFTVDDVTVPHGKLDDLRTDDNITWHATLTPEAGAASTDNVLTLDLTGIANGEGNVGVGTESSVGYDVDTVRPALASDIASSDTTLTSGDTATVTFTFDEAVTGFTIENVDVPNGTLSTLDSSDGGKTWTATLTPKSGASDASNVLTLHYAGITDLAGNAAIGEIASGNYAVDTTAPALAEPIDIDDTALRIGETATVTFVFAQAVTGFTSANVSVPNGALSEPTSEDGITWTATLTPNPGATAHANVLTLNYAGILNGAGNANSGIVTSGNYAVDTRAPTATVTLSDLDLRAGETAQLTVSFDEIVTGFDKSAVTAPNGALGDFTTLDDGKTWSATFTPTANTNVASNVISVSLAGVSDLAGNPGAGSASSPTYAVQTTPPVTPPTNPPTNPPATGTVDGVTVERETLPVDPVTGLAGTALIVPVITSSRPDDPNTPNGDLADIPLGLGSGTGPRTELMVSLPVGTGMRAEGPSSLLTNAQALLDLIRRIENQTEAGSSAQLGMTGNGAGFLGSLAPDTLLQSQTLVLSAAPGLVAPQTILVSGSSTTPVGGGQNATAIGLVIDTTGLPAGSTLQLNNVDFAAIVGAATVRGGDGRNFVTGDDASQNIFLGADDDVLMGGGGNDIIGSAGGNDLLDGGSGDDILVGGIGNDRLVGGAGNNVLQGGRSTQGGWEFYLAANGTLMARHETALFAPGQEERLALAELNESATELAFLDADKAMLSSLSLLYHAAFGRAPDLGGLAYWALGGASIEAVADYILRSPEWQSAGGTAMSDTAFVEAVYGNAFGRAPDAGGLAYWTGLLAGTGGAPALGRAEALVAIAHSAEHHSAWNTADGYLIGEADLDLEADWIVDDGIDTAVYGGKSADYKFIVDGDGRLKVEHKTSGALDQLVGIDLGEFSDGTLDLGFLQGNQATVKQLGLLYQTVLDRAGDLGGFQWWLERDIHGARLVQDFIATDEFRARYDGISDAAFVQALYDNSGLDATAVGGMASWENYLENHTRAELIATWLTQDGVVDAQFTGPGLWVV